MYALEIKNLTVYIKTEAGIVNPVKGMTFAAEKGAVTGIVGDSGAGKSMSMKAVLGILPANAWMECTEICLEGRNLLREGKNRARAAWIPQNPSAALDPVFQIGTQVTETIIAHDRLRKKEAKIQAEKLLAMAGLEDPEKCMKMYPFELSGGMCQRAAAAMAMAADPQVIIADEPTASLDHETKKGILRLFENWVKEHDTSVVMISHDLNAVNAVCRDIYVMLDGQIVESGRKDEIFADPRHSYTKLLLSGYAEEELWEYEQRG